MNERKPQNHFGLFICNFLLRTQSNVLQLSELSTVKRSYILLYIESGVHPQIKQFMLLADGMSQISKTTKNRMITRLYDAIAKDFNRVPYPPNKRELRD